MAMTDAQLLARMRDLTALGKLPDERPQLHQAGVRRGLPLSRTSALSAASQDPTSPMCRVVAGWRTYTRPAMRSGSWNESSD